LNDRITASDYVIILGSQVRPMVQMFPKNNAVFFKMTIRPHTVRSVHSWLEEYDDTL